MTQISNLPAASALGGGELVPVTQAGTTVKTTTAAIAALVTPASGITTLTSAGGTIAITNVSTGVDNIEAVGVPIANLVSGVGAIQSTDVLAVEALSNTTTYKLTLGQLFGFNSTKPSVRVVSVANIASLNGVLGSTDGIVLGAGQLILLTAQSTQSQNGPWVISAGAWSRPPWYASGSSTQAHFEDTIYVVDGSAYANSTWKLTTSGTITIDINTTTWAQVTNGISAGTPPAGSAGNVQFNSGSSFGADPLFTYNTGSGNLFLGGTGTNGSLSGGLVGATATGTTLTISGGAGGATSGTGGTLILNGGSSVSGNPGGVQIYGGTPGTNGVGSGVSISVATNTNTNANGSGIFITSGQSIGNASKTSGVIRLTSPVGTGGALSGIIALNTNGVDQVYVDGNGVLFVKGTINLTSSNSNIVLGQANGIYNANSVYTGAASPVTIAGQSNIFNGVTSPVTVNFPTTPGDGYVFEINNGAAIASVTLSGGAATINGGVAAFAANTTYSWKYVASITTWFRRI